MKDLKPMSMKLVVEFKVYPKGYTKAKQNAQLSTIRTRVGAASLLISKTYFSPQILKYGNSLIILPGGQRELFMHSYVTI